MCGKPRKFYNIFCFFYRSVYYLVHLFLNFMKLMSFAILELIIPKDPNLIIFAGSHGQYYDDNSRYLFEFYLNNSDLKCYWLTNNKNLLITLRKKFYNRVLYGKAIHSLLLFLKAKTVIIDVGRGDVEPYQLLNYRKNVINLWHGIPLKRVGFLDENADFNKLFKETKNYNFMICSSELEREIMSASFHLPIQSIWLTGSPRNDILSLKDSKLLTLFPFLSKKIILYAPTWRDNLTKVKFFPFSDFNLQEILIFLEKYDAYILLRGHRKEYEKTFSGLSYENKISNRVFFADRDLFPDVNDLLPYVDILISDYSSIFFDYLLLDRPMIFIPYDYEDYNKYRGFAVDYFSYTPGPKVYTQKDFLTNIENYLNKSDCDSENRKKIRDIFHKYQDFKA